MPDNIPPQTNININPNARTQDSSFWSRMLPDIQNVKNPFYDMNFRYPDDLENYHHYVTFSFSEYKRRSIFDQVYEMPIGNIRLPIPSNIVDKIEVGYEQTPSNLAVGAGMELGLRQSAEAGAGAALAGAAASGLASIALGAATVAANRSSPVIGSALGSLGQGVQNVAPFALQPFGLAVNPFLTVLFKTPTFKRHAFSWRLSANNPKESETINNIIMAFKYSMLPDIAANYAGVLLKYPDICHVRFNPINNWLYKFKPCVVESVRINYAPNAQPSFFDNDAPTDIDFSINLLEIEYWTKQDYGRGY